MIGSSCVWTTLGERWFIRFHQMANLSFILWQEQVEQKCLMPVPKRGAENTAKLDPREHRSSIAKVSTDLNVVRCRG